MSNDFFTQILGSVLGGAGQQGLPGGLGGLGGLGGGLGSVLGSVFGGGTASEPTDGSTGDAAAAGGKGALLAMMLPLAMQWVQRNGGVGAVLDRFRQQGQGQQVASWISTGENQPVTPDAVGEVVGLDELSRLSQQLGVPSDQVAGGLAQILPHVVNHLTPAGHIPQDADDVLASGLSAVQELFGRRA